MDVMAFRRLLDMRAQLGRRTPLDKRNDGRDEQLNQPDHECHDGRARSRAGQSSGSVWLAIGRFHRFRRSTYDQNTGSTSVLLDLLAGPVVALPDSAASRVAHSAVD
jgi:hypothetical protein